MKLFVDTSAWFAAAYRHDKNHGSSRRILAAESQLLTSDHVLGETWQLLRRRIHRGAAEAFWDNVRGGVALVETVTAADLEAAWNIGQMFPDQDFSLVDRTSFAVMERLGVHRVAAFDDHFAVYRFGRKRDRAFEVVH